MHHVLMDQWSRGRSPLHERDARAKILALLIFLIVLATTAPQAYTTLAIDAAVLAAAILIARLPFFNLLARAAVVLPFSLIFGAITWMMGNSVRALGLIEKSYLSTVSVLIVVGTTPLASLLHGMESLGAPRLLTLLAQFLYRYLFVISEQAQHMRIAAASRQGTHEQRHRQSRMHAAGGALAVLFARSYQRAEGIHRAMLARGFSGKFATLDRRSFRLADGLFAAGVAAFLILVRVQ